DDLRDPHSFPTRRSSDLIRGPLKVYDSRPALIGGLFAQREGFFPAYTREVYARFFRRELEIDDGGAIADLIAVLGHSPEAYRELDRKSTRLNSSHVKSSY